MRGKEIGEKTDLCTSGLFSPYSLLFTFPFSLFTPALHCLEGFRFQIVLSGTEKESGKPSLCKGNSGDLYSVTFPKRGLSPATNKTVVAGLKPVEFAMAE